MKLVIHINERFEEQKALVDLDSGKVLVSGDEYHDKISERIEGYLKALNDFDIYNVSNKDIPEEYIDKNHKYYEVVDF